VRLNRLISQRKNEGVLSNETKELLCWLGGGWRALQKGWRAYTGRGKQAAGNLIS
jgi:hypothetical protein